MATFEKRVSNTGQISYRAKVRRIGTKPLTATFRRLTDAKIWATQVESAIYEGKSLKLDQSKRRTVNDAIERYSNEVVGQLRDAVNRARHLGWWQSELGEIQLTALDSATIVKVRSVLRAERKRSDTTVNRYMASLSAVLSYAAGEWGWMEANPCLQIRRLKEPPGRTRFLSDAERIALLDACEKAKAYPEMKLIVLLALTTGMRRGEILNLRWKDVNFKTSVITLWRTKNGEIRTVPLVSPAFELMHSWACQNKQEETGLVFPSHRATWKDSPLAIDPIWHRIRAEAGLSDFRFHDLRHTAASYLAMNGAGLREIGDILGHKTLSMVQRYSHLTHDHRHKTVSRMTDAVFGGNQ